MPEIATLCLSHLTVSAGKEPFRDLNPSSAKKFGILFPSVFGGLAGVSETTRIARELLISVVNAVGIEPTTY